MKFYINTREAKHERPHVHVARGKGRSSDLKIWLLPEVSMGRVLGEFSARDVKGALSIAEAMQKQFIEDYEAEHGKKIARAQPRQKKLRPKK